MRTTVGVVGGGPAGLLPAWPPHREGIGRVVPESGSRAYAERRRSAGMPEPGTADALRERGAGDRLDAEGLPHRGIEPRFERERHRIDFSALTGGRGVVIYPRTEIMKGLTALQLACGTTLLSDVEVLAVENPLSGVPVVRFVHERREQTPHRACAVGRDAGRGISRAAFPAGAFRTCARDHPYPWLGILADVPPSGGELVRARCDRVRTARPALAHTLAALFTGPERHRRRRPARPAHPGRAGRAPRGRRRPAAEPRPRHGQVRAVAAQSCP
ncbi:FAD-dependent monooxygenase [Streptomyces fagopyri]|uniref:FAD-dependent monooxygenase n=1 Tax=Streptomyces fagopyri TaxID=2662397 RepID=UPI00381B74DA